MPLLAWPYAPDRVSVFQLLIPKPLYHEHRINKAVIASYDQLPRGLMCEYGSEEVGEISQTPFYQEKYGEAGRALERIVLVDLW